MPVHVLRDAYFTVGGTNLSQYVKSIELSYEADAQEVTAMGANTHISIGGLKNWSVTVTFNQDFASGAVDAVIWPLVGSTATIAIRPTSGTRSATNPEYTGTALVRSYTPISGEVGEVHEVQVEFVAAGDLSRLTA